MAVHVCRKEAELATHDAEISNFRDWQKTQNGTLQRMGERLDKVFESQRAIMGGLVVASIMLAFNLAVALLKR